MSWLIRVGKCFRKTRHLADVPGADVLMRLYAWKMLQKDPSLDWPSADVLVEFCVGKCFRKTRHLADVPGADVLVEIERHLKCIRKILHLADVPRANVLVEIMRPDKCLRKTRHC